MHALGRPDQMYPSSGANRAHQNRMQQFSPRFSEMEQDMESENIKLRLHST